MTDDRLWAPWRIGYIRGEGGSASPDARPPEPSAWREGAERTCFLCQAAASFENQAQADRRLLVVSRSEHALAVLNRYPYNNGHTLVAPQRHVGELEWLTPVEHLACIDELNRLITAYRRHMNADGFNVGLNLGRAGGAGLLGHLHWHVVPRWNGDSNFMPVLAGSRVMSQSLDALWESLTTDWLRSG